MYPNRWAYTFGLDLLFSKIYNINSVICLFFVVVFFSSKILVLGFPTIETHKYCLGMTSISVNGCVLECLHV